MSADLERPEPLVPPDIDLRGFSYMPLLGERLFGSNFDLDASDAEFRIGLRLWWEAWKQVPAGSLPREDHRIAGLVGLKENPRKWQAVRDRALAGFVECSDGRLYHPIVCEQAMIAWEKRGETQQVKENTAERVRRLRDERRQLFAALKAAGEVPDFNLPMKALRSLHQRIVGRDSSGAVTPEVTGAVTPEVTDAVTRTVTAKTGRDVTLKDPPNPPAGGRRGNRTRVPAGTAGGGGGSGGTEGGDLLGDGDASGPRAARTLRVWMADEKAAGRPAMPKTDAVFTYAAEVKLPREFLAVAWWEFRTRYLEREKRYRDWRRVFRGAVRANWLRLWYLASDGTYALTTVGVQAQRALEAAQARGEGPAPPRANSTTEPVTTATEER